MIRAYGHHAERLVKRAPDADLATILWFDLEAPTQEEETALEARLGLDLPTRDEMREIEQSARLYVENGAVFMTATLPASSEGESPVLEPVTFVLSDRCLVTVRYHTPRAFTTFPTHAAKGLAPCDTPAALLASLLDAMVERQADLLEHVGAGIDGVSRDIFRHRTQAGKPRPDKDMRAILENIGRMGDLSGNIRLGLLSLERLVGFLALNLGERTGERVAEIRGAREARPRVKVLARDVRALSEHAAFLDQKITFLLDAALGFINIEQNAIIKIFSVAAVGFLPPTLVASIYGMNFQFMPELDWGLGYPLALGLMALSAALPLWYFRRRGWL